MALTPRLDLRQTQSLVMTPQLQQAIKLLQLSNVELTQFVEQELERNPLLEREDGEGAVAEEAPAEPKNGAGEEAPPEPPLIDGLPGQAEEAPLDIDYENTWNNDSTADLDGPQLDWGNHGGRTDFEERESSLEQTLFREVSLRDHLTGQLNTDIAEPGDRLIGLYLMEQLDEAGYLFCDLAEAAATLGCGVARMEQVLARRDMAGLMRICGVDLEDLTEMIGEIRSLDPKPALAFDYTVAQPVIPDVLMRAAPDGGWIVELNSDTLPRVLVSARYYAKVSAAARNKDEKSYLSERFQSANWLVKSLHQRANTILKVATEIVRQQEAFFLRGIQHLRPLVLRDIAGAIGMHESTVSRVTANKYMATPRGIFELKYFFTQAIAGSDGGEAHSAEAVRHRIKTLIDNEGSEDVLSDDRIVEILKAGGVDIARRTVAKYREAMHIPSSVQRRRDKVMGNGS